MSILDFNISEENIIKHNKKETTEAKIISQFDHLATGIIIQTLKDFVKYKKANDKYGMLEIEHFIDSEWYLTLSRIPPAHFKCIINNHSGFITNRIRAYNKNNKRGDMEDV